MSWMMDGRRILRLAQQMETAGRAFYLRLRDRASDRNVQDLLGRLAEDESDHEKLFSDMRERIEAGLSAEAEAAETHDSMRQCLEIAETLVRCDPIAALDEMPELPDVHDLLSKAIRMEEETVGFYAKMRDITPEPADRETIDAIIREEYGHAQELRKTRELLG